MDGEEIKSPDSGPGLLIAADLHWSRHLREPGHAAANFEVLTSWRGDSKWIFWLLIGAAPEGRGVPRGDDQSCGRD